MLDQPGRMTMVNGTTTRGCARILEARPKELGMLTVNEAEASAMMRAVPTVRESKLMERLNARSMLVTRGRNGWDLHRSGEKTVSSPAVEVPGAYGLHRLRGLRGSGGRPRPGPRAGPEVDDQRIHPPEAGVQRGEALARKPRERS